MADQETQTALQQEQAQQTTTESAKTGAKTYTEAELQQILKDRLEREKQSEAKRLEAEKAKAEEAKLKEQNEWKALAEKHQAELEQTKAELAARNLADKKRTIAAKYGIPESLAVRLLGNTDEELEADAKSLAETLPKRQEKASPGPTNPGEDKQSQETDAQKYARLTGIGLKSDWARGGGVVAKQG